MLATTETGTRSPVIDGALRAAAGLTGMEVVYLAEVTPTTFTWTRVLGSWPGVVEGESIPRADSFCHRMLAGATPITSDAAADPAYADAPVRARLGIASYVGVPVVTADDGVAGTLCAIDRRGVEVSPDTLAVLRALAEVVADASGGGTGVRLRRERTGWRVEAPRRPDEPVESLTLGMVLADLLVDDLVPPPRPQRPEETVSETDRLRLQVTQLEHALATRVVVEQAIGVLAERWGTSTRSAFERMRKVARSRGARVHDIARQVVRSAHESVEIPAELR